MKKIIAKIKKVLPLIKSIYRLMMAIAILGSCVFGAIAWCVDKNFEYAVIHFLSVLIMLHISDHD